MRESISLTGQFAAVDEIRRGAIHTGVALLIGFRTGASAAAWLAVAGILILFTLALTSIVNTIRLRYPQWDSNPHLKRF